MGVDTLRRIKKAEDDKAEKIVAAQAEAEKVRKRAERTAANLVEGAKKEAEGAVAALRAQKVSEGRAEADRILAASAKDLQRMKLVAEKNLEKAAGLVLEKVCS